MFYRARFFQIFFKITAYIPQKIIFRNRVFYEDKSVQNRHIHGKAIVVSNHLSVYDYISMIFVFFSRTTRCIAAEILFSKNIFLTLFLKLMGLMKVDRYSENHDFGFEETAKKVLEKNGVVVFYPESRVPDKTKNETMLPFKTTFVYMALATDTSIIPYYSNGKVFSKNRCLAIIGKPMNLKDYYDDNLSEVENRHKITEIVRNKIIFLGEELERQNSQKN